MNTTDTTLDTLVEELMTTRDMCGSQPEAIRQWEEDNGRKLTPQERRTAIAMLNSRWREAQTAAGVAHPLSDEERAQAYAVIQNSRA